MRGVRRSPRKDSKRFSPQAINDTRKAQEELSGAFYGSARFNPFGQPIQGSFMTVVTRLARRRLAIGIAVTSLLFQVMMSCFHFAPSMASSMASPWGSNIWGPNAPSAGLFVCSRAGVKNPIPGDSGLPAQTPGGDATKNCMVCLAFSEASLGAPVAGPVLFSARPAGGFHIWRGEDVPGGVSAEFVNSRGPPRAKA